MVQLDFAIHNFVWLTGFVKNPYIKMNCYLRLSKGPSCTTWQKKLPRCELLKVSPKKCRGLRVTRGRFAFYICHMSPKHEKEEVCMCVNVYIHSNIYIYMYVYKIIKVYKSTNIEISQNTTSTMSTKLPSTKTDTLPSGLHAADLLPICSTTNITKTALT